MDADYLLIGKVGKPHGLRGEVKVHPCHSSRESFYPGLQVYGEQGSQIKYRRLSAVKVQGRTLLCRFQGVDNRNQAEELQGESLYLQEKDLRPLPDGEYYGYQIIGSRVYNDRDVYLGVMEEIFSTAAHDVWVIRDGEKERLYPAVAECILSVDQSRKQIRLRDYFDPAEGDDR
jgi:16S rRNA processing protein RimM